jgi:hypothetical protein
VGDGRDRVGLPGLIAVAGLAVGTMLVAAGWSRAAGTGDLAAALDAIPLAAVGLTVCAAGFVVYTVWLRFRLTARLRLVLVVPAASAEPAGKGLGERWMVDGYPIVHRTTCPTLRYADGDRTLVTAGVDGGLPCRLCEAGE